MRSSTRLAQALAITVAVGLSLAACGDKAAPGADGGGTKPTTSVKTSRALSQSDFNERMFGAVEKAGSAKIHFEAGSGNQKSSGDGEVKYGDPLALRIRTNTPAAAGGAQQEVLLIGDTAYVGSSGHYVSVALDAIKGSGMPDFTTNLDPKVQSKVYDKAIVSFKQDGAAETLDSVQAKPYVVTLDPAKAPDVFGTMVKGPLTFTYFVGPDDLPRKMVYHDEHGDFVATYSDWGSPVTVKAPPASQVTKGIG